MKNKLEHKFKVTVDGRRMTDSQILTELFKNRGVENPDEFLNPSSKYLLPSKEFKYIDKAAEIVMSTIKNKGKFLIYFDSDVDGCTSGAIATRYLRNYTDNIETYINNGKLHGIKDFDFSRLNDVETLIIVDAIEDTPDNYQKILDMGIKLTVWDHHIVPAEVEEMIPDIALVSSAYKYPNPALSGSGVTWKVCHHIDEITGNSYADLLMDLAATGILADMCSVGPKSMENRYICNTGLANLNNLAIKKINGSYTFDATSVSFGIAPLINAANRMEQNGDAMRLFIEDDEDEVAKLTKELQNCKDRQQRELLSVWDDIEIQGEKQRKEPCMFFFVDSDYGVSGLIANKLLEKYNRPVFVISQNDKNADNDTYNGSMRAVGVENMTKIVNSTYLAKCMGHENAAGFSCEKDKFEDFKKAICKKMSGLTLTKTYKVDLQLRLSQVTNELIDSLKALNFVSGTDSAPIKVLIENVSGYEVGDFKNRTHLKISTPNMLFIKWNFNNWENVEDGASMCAVGTLDSGFFGRKFYKKMIMDDFFFEEKIEF